MIVILTGAGISHESGIATFRDSDGLWENERVEDVATPGGFARDPERVYRFYNQRRRDLQNGIIVPNAAHKALARLEKEYPGKVLVITQNVDNLHERGGSHNVLHMHGELLQGRCAACEAVFPCLGDMNSKDVCPSCGKAGHVRPHIVWFEEMPLYMEQIEDALEQCRVFASIGTSGNVYPAAGFVRHAKAHGAHTVELNLQPSVGASVFAESRYGLATQVVPAWVNELLLGKR